MTVFLVGLVGCPSPSAQVRAPTTSTARDDALVVPPLTAAESSGNRNSRPGIVFGHPNAVVGAAWTVEVSAFSQAPDPQGGLQISTYLSDYRVDVLAVDGPAPARVRLRFDRNVRAYQEKETPTIIDGKEYVIDAQAPHVREVSGAAAPPDQTERVLDVFPDLGTRARIDEVMPDDAMQLGDRHDELAGAILRVIHPRAWTLREGSATLAKTDGGDGVFTVKLDASSTSGLRLVVSGEARVRLKDARLSDLALEGTYEEPKGTPDAAPGTFRLRRTMRDAK